MDFLQNPIPSEESLFIIRHEVQQTTGLNQSKKTEVLFLEPAIPLFNKERHNNKPTNSLGVFMQLYGIQETGPDAQL